MNGVERPSNQGSDPFTSLLLSLDATTLDQALGKRRVKAIEPNGSVIYEELKEPNSAFTEELERVWNEHPNGLLDVTEEQLAALPQEEKAVKSLDTPSDEVEKRDPSRSMTFEDIEKLRSEVYLQLNDARNELWFVLELLKTLSASQSFTNQPPSDIPQPPPKKLKPKPNAKPADKPAQIIQGQIEPPVLPPGTYSTTPAAAPVRSTHAQVHDLELVLAAKQQALDECSALIDSAVSELQLMATAGDRFWRDVRTLKDGNDGQGLWAVVPKPDFGRTMAEGEKAKDIIIPYAVDEASRATRARCLAAFDLDPRKKEALTFGARSHLRLRATLRDDSGAVLGSTPVKSEDASDVRATMEAAQMEAFDEELFNEIRGEASTMYRSEIEQRTVKIPAAEYDLIFELYDPRIAQTTTSSPLCDVVLSAARLGRLNVLRQRKVNLVSPSASYISSVPSILQPIIQVLRYRQICGIIGSILHSFANTLKAAGIDATVGQTSSRDAIANGSDLEDLLTGKANATMLTENYTLKVTDIFGASIDVAAPSTILVKLSNASFNLANPEELSHILADELSVQLIGPVYRQLRAGLPEKKHQSVVFLDELEDLIDIAGLGLLRISIPPPFHTLFGRVDSHDGQAVSHVSDGEHELRSFDGRGNRNIRDWIEELVERVKQA